MTASVFILRFPMQEIIHLISDMPMAAPMQPGVCSSMETFKATSISTIQATGTHGSLQTHRFHYSLASIRSLCIMVPGTAGRSTWTTCKSDKISRRNYKSQLKATEYSWVSFNISCACSILPARGFSTITCLPAFKESLTTR